MADDASEKPGAEADPPGRPRPRRRLASIVYVDMVGFSRLVGRAEADTLARWKSLRDDVIDPLIGAHAGRTVKVAGDGLLLEFASAVEGVACAIDLQKTIAGINRDLPPGTRLDFRIGAHVGDVVVEGDDILGHEVNIAERLQAQAEPGGVLISGVARAGIGNRLAARFQDAGELHLKHIAEPMRAFRWLRDADAPAQDAGDADAGAPLPRYGRPSVAVFPLANRTGDAGVDHIAYGIMEDVIALLARMPSLLVIAHDSTRNVAGGAAEARAGAAQFGVRYVLRGSLRGDRDALVVVAQLLDAASDTVAWSERFTAGRSAILDLQDGLAMRIVERIVPHIEAEELRRIHRKRPLNLDAYELTLLALSHDATLLRTRNDEGIGLLHRAIAADRDYADSYAWLAKAHILRIAQGWSADPAADRAEAARYSALAVEKDPYGPLGLAIHAHSAAFLLRDYGKAQQLFERALRVSPSHALVWTYSAFTATYLRDPCRAIDHAGYALRLSPFDLHASLLYLSLGLAHFANRDDAKALAALRRSVQASPDHTAAWRVLAWTLARAGEADEARLAGSRLLALEPGFRVSDYRARAPFMRPEDRDEVADLLGRAGLPN